MNWNVAQNWPKNDKNNRHSALLNPRRLEGWRSNTGRYFTKSGCKVCTPEFSPDPKEQHLTNSMTQLVIQLWYYSKALWNGFDFARHFIRQIRRTIECWVRWGLRLCTLLAEVFFFVILSLLFRCIFMAVFSATVLSPGKKTVADMKRLRNRSVKIKKKPLLAR